MVKKKTLEQHKREFLRKKEAAINSELKKYDLLSEIACKKIREEYNAKFLKAAAKNEKFWTNKMERFEKNRVRKEKGHKVVEYVGKRKTLAQLFAELLGVIQEFVRLLETNEKGYGKCFTCKCMLHRKNVVEGKKAHGGHGIPSKKKGSALMLENIHLQCDGCNLYQYKTGDISKYEAAMVELFGQKVRKKIVDQSKEKVVLGKGKYTRDFLESEILFYQKKVIELKTMKQ